VPLVVVAAAIVDNRGRLLAAQRGYPAALRGRWELPGGKVHEGETEPAALARECREELGIEIAVGDPAATAVPTTDGAGTLRTYWAGIVDGDPQPREHLALRWLRADELGDVDWLDADLPVIAELRAGLLSPP
jgi:8-oxo-dGTP diphosphatase